MADTDKDGLTDEFERRIGTDPRSKDTDRDGLTDGAERRLGTSPTNRDSDGDGFDDGSEIAQHRNPLHTDARLPYGGRDQPARPTADDPDADRLDDMQEGMLGTNPNDPDSDGDGIGDWVESIRGTNPTSPFSDGPKDKTTDLDDVAKDLQQMQSTSSPGARSASADVGGRSAIDSDVVLTGFSGRTAFINAARAQIGDSYQFGAETDLNDSNPNAFDSSELVQWSAAQAGIKLPDGSWNQYRHLQQGGNAVSVDSALQTPGALVFGFSSDPLASAERPASAYVGISLGNGKVLDVSERAGEVREMDPGTYYTHAAVIPELQDDYGAGSDVLLAQQSDESQQQPPAGDSAEQSDAVFASEPAVAMAGSADGTSSSSDADPATPDAEAPSAANAATSSNDVGAPADDRVAVSGADTPQDAGTDYSNVDPGALAQDNSGTSEPEWDTSDSYEPQPYEADTYASESYSTDSHSDAVAVVRRARRCRRVHGVRSMTDWNDPAAKLDLDHVVNDVPADFPHTNWNDPAATQDLDHIVDDVPADFPHTDWNDPAATQEFDHL